MSHQAVDWVLKRSRTTGAARLVMLSIAHHADRDTGEAWPAQPTIAAEANIAERSIRRVFERDDGPVALGELEVVPGEGGTAVRDPRYRPTLYRLVGYLSERTTGPPSGGATGPPSGGTVGPPRGDRGSDSGRTVGPGNSHREQSRNRAPSPEPSLTAAREALMARDRRRREGHPECSACEDLGTVEGPDGLRHRCPDCTPGAA